MGLGRCGSAKKRGQALVLACLVILVLCLAVLATLNLGHNVTERVRLQNTADAAAHSIAAMEARAFNFYAFSNRTQVSHYVSAMVWQSYLSFIYFSEAFLTDVYGVMKSLNGCAGARGGFWLAACPVLEAIPYLGPVIRALSVVIQLYRGVVYAYQTLLRTMDPDFVIGRKIIPAHRALNQALAIASEAVMLSALSQAAQTAKPIIEENDRNVDLTFSQSIGGALTVCLSAAVHCRPPIRSSRFSLPRSRRAVGTREPSGRWAELSTPPDLPATAPEGLARADSLLAAN